LSLGLDAELIDELEGLIGEYPYRERLWRQLMLALYRANARPMRSRPTDAHAGSSTKLGLEPGEELQRLEQVDPASRSRRPDRRRNATTFPPPSPASWVARRARGRRSAYRRAAS
jgi:DNA-binding SARP family transcriptional activator